MALRLCIFEDGGVLSLDPLTLTRPAFDLLCGASSLLKRQRRFFAASEVGTLVRPPLAELCRFAHPDLIVNDVAWLQADTALLVNARWLPPVEAPTELLTPRVALAGDQVAYAVVPPRYLADCSPLTVDECLLRWKDWLPACAAGGVMIDYPWDLIEHNGDVLGRDFLDLARGKDNGWGPADRLAVVGPADRLRVAATAQIEPMVVADTTKGPVIIDREAVVQSFTRLEGPCYVGPQSWVVGAKVRGSTIGPVCRVGGEVEASILHGYSNKYHDGFLGHSYVGEWVNLGAGTQTSDLRNDYGTVTVTVNGRKVNTGRSKVGSFLGDHTKTGLCTLLNTGTVAGAFCNLLPTAGYLPKYLPSFCTFWNGQIVEGPELTEVVSTAATVMRRRDHELTSLQAAFIRNLREQTAWLRRQVIHEGEQRRARRRSV